MYNLFSQGSGIAPGCYSYNSPTEELLNKTVGNRGPYDLYSGKRIPDIKEINQLAPGSYDHKPFTSELNSNYIIVYSSCMYAISIARSSSQEAWTV